MAGRIAAQRAKPAAAEPPGLDIDLRGAGTILGIAGLLLLVFGRLKTNALVILTSVLLSVGASLLAIHFTFGTYFVPASYRADQETTRGLTQTLATTNAELTARMEEKFALVDRNREDINLIVDQIGQQIDGFWIPLTFDIDRIKQGEEFILPIDMRHDVEMMITATDRDVVDFLEQYLALDINKMPVESLQAYINIPKPRKLVTSLFNKGQDGQSFKLKFRNNASAQERVQYEADFSSIRQVVNHIDRGAGRISVLLVVRRPIFMTGSEENLPEPGSN